MPASALMNVMTAAARKAGRSLARDFGEVEQLQVSVKGPGNFVTAADHRAEEIIQRELEKARPGYAFLMEESGAIDGVDKTHRWIVDPLDGTLNFLHGIPIFSISIALEREGQLVAGIVYNPVLDETYTAEKGKGAFLNDRRLRVSSRRVLADCVIGTGIPNVGNSGHVRFLKECAIVMAQTAGLRRLGSAALDLCYVAAGRFDGFWEPGLSPWDIGAGILIVREAGGFVTGRDGSSDALKAETVVAGNAQIHKSLRELLDRA